MRSIKFRAWDVNNKWMRRVLGIKFTEKTISGIDSFLLEDNKWHAVGNPWVIMQFTGLTDKNGKDIYEGDVITQGNPNDKCGWMSPRVVEFKNGSWMVSTIRIYTNQDISKYQGKPTQDKWEVIGNKFENPNLLNQDQLTTTD